MGGQSSVWGGGSLRDVSQGRAHGSQCRSGGCRPARSHCGGGSHKETGTDGHTAGEGPCSAPQGVTPQALPGAPCSPHPASPPHPPPPGPSLLPRHSQGSSRRTWGWRDRRPSVRPSLPFPSWPLWVVCAGSRSLPGMVALGTSAASSGRRSRFLRHFPPRLTKTPLIGGHQVRWPQAATSVGTATSPCHARTEAAAPGGSRPFEGHPFIAVPAINREQDVPGGFRTPVPPHRCIPAAGTWHPAERGPPRGRAGGARVCGVLPPARLPAGQEMLYKGGTFNKNK